MESEVDSLLHQGFHHKIINKHFHLKVCYHPPYIREIWYYQRIIADQILRAIRQKKKKK